MTPAWKAKYIRLFVAESPVWSGTPQTLLTYICGLVGPTPGNQSTLCEFS